MAADSETFGTEKISRSAVRALGIFILTMGITQLLADISGDGDDHYTGGIFLLPAI